MTIEIYGELSCFDAIKEIQCGIQEYNLPLEFVEDNRGLGVILQHKSSKRAWVELDPYRLESFHQVRAELGADIKTIEDILNKPSIDISWHNENMFYKNGSSDWRDPYNTRFSKKLKLIYTDNGCNLDFPSFEKPYLTPAGSVNISLFFITTPEPFTQLLAVIDRHSIIFHNNELLDCVDYAIELALNDYYQENGILMEVA